MSRLAFLALPLALTLVACGDKEEEDTDGDGISDTDEEALGTDPENADSDADGLEDGVEADMGTDPLAVDTDGDTYWDSWEVTEGTDPLDESSRIYIGYWPYNPDKDSMEMGDWSDFDGSEDQFLPGTQLLDQWGDTVDLHDFAGQGKPIMIDVSAIWCGPCNGLASWLSGGSDPYDWNSYWPHVREAVENGDMYWITVLSQDNNGNVPDLSDLEGWYEDYTDERVAILSDENEDFVQIVSAFPSMFFFDENFQLVQAPGSVNFYKPMDVAEEMFAE